MSLSVIGLVFIAAGSLAAQNPASDLREDPQLTEALREAYNSGLPHRRLLAEHIERIRDALSSEWEPGDFKLGAMAVLRHSDFSNDLKMGELYLRLLQQPVVDDIFDSFDAASAITVDGSMKDWPRGAILRFPDPDGKSDHALESFAVLRGRDRLVVLFETDQSQDESKLIYSLEVSTLATRYNEPVYTINIAGQQIRLFNADGEELAVHSNVPIKAEHRGRVLELAIPLKRLDEDLRSIAIRGYVIGPRAGARPLKSPWVACPSGPISEPTEMLIYFASRRSLPEGSPLPLAVALEEGLLLASSHPDLAERIKSDAYTFFELSLRIDNQVASTDVPSINNLSIPALLAWACRHDGHESLGTIEEYELKVPSPKTLADMHGYALVKDWFKDANPEILRGRIAGLMSLEFKTYDYPDEQARRKGEEYEDPNPAAYFTHGAARLLSYRDVGINQRWQFFEQGFGLKGNRAQAVEFQRLLGHAVGLPSVWAWHRHRGKETHYTLGYDGRKERWYIIGLSRSKLPEKARLFFAWGKPWTRPERFDFWDGRPELLPEGYARYFLDGDVDELTRRRFESILEKGLTDQTMARTLLAPLRMR